jgi:outer membrane beta-barrel protein
MDAVFREVPRCPTPDLGLGCLTVSEKRALRSLVAIACLAAARPALAQEAPGLDLSEPPKPKEGDATELPPIDLSRPPGTPPKAAPPEKAEAPEAVPPFSEKDVALGDKVKAVQRKGFLKRGRFEVAPVLAVTVNDAFYQKFGGGLRLAYHLHDSFALALRGVTYRKPGFSDPRSWQPAPIRTDNAREGKVAFGGQLLSSQIYDQLMLDGMWSPVYGKVSVGQKHIVHFDLFLAAGFGLVWSATTEPPRNEPPHLATDFGGGIRFYPKDWLALEAGLMATLYPDRPIASLPATVQKVFAANIGVSFFFPMSFDYVYP